MSIEAENIKELLLRSDPVGYWKSRHDGLEKDLEYRDKYIELLNSKIDEQRQYYMNIGACLLNMRVMMDRGPDEKTKEVILYLEEVLIKNIKLKFDPSILSSHLVVNGDKE